MFHKTSIPESDSITMNGKSNTISIVILVGIIAGCSKSPLPVEEQSPSTAKSIHSENRDHSVKTEIAMHAQIEKIHYDKMCSLLSVRVYIENRTSKPCYLVAKDFSFVHFEPGSTHHDLMVQQTSDELLLDLSHLITNQSGYKYFSGEWGSFGFSPQVFRFGPKELRYITYTFQFPLVLDMRFSKYHRFEAPKGSTKVRLRFGFGEELFDSFVEKNFRQSPNIEAWQESILKDWQQTFETAPVTVDFSPKPTKKE